MHPSGSYGRGHDSTTQSHSDYDGALLDELDDLQITQQSDTASPRAGASYASHSRQYGRSSPTASANALSPHSHAAASFSNQALHAERGGSSRSRGRYRARGGRPTDNRSRHSYRTLWRKVTSLKIGERLTEGELVPYSDVTVEDLLKTIRNLPPGTSAVAAVRHGLQFLDSRALAALLKELSKTGFSQVAFEIFEWLRTVDESADSHLYSLCDVYTYTTMIAQCGSHHHLRTALELVAEMRSRDIQCNVHTYSALMNVCIKANELDLALDVYQQMLQEGITPNLVTYNTLVDVYGKAGRWQDAVQVLDILIQQGLEAEVRTYNTILIACNLAGQPLAAVKVYDRMLNAGAIPTAATFTAAITAHSRLGELDTALELYHDMLSKGLERTAVTYNALLVGCEKSGRWQLALELVQRLQDERSIKPAAATYAAAMGACISAGQLSDAEDILTTMQAQGVKPESATYALMFNAFDKHNKWRDAMRLYEALQRQPVRPDVLLFRPLLDCLWSSGILSACSAAQRVFEDACRLGVFRLGVQLAGGQDGLEFLLPAHSITVAILACWRLFGELRERIAHDGLAILKQCVTLVIGEGPRDYLAIRAALVRALQGAGSPFSTFDSLTHRAKTPWVIDGVPGGLQLTAGALALAEWLTNPPPHCPLPLAPSLVDANPVKFGHVIEEDDACEAQYQEAFAAVLAFEQHHTVDAQMMSPTLLVHRTHLLTLLISWWQHLGLPDEILQSSMQLLDRCLSSGLNISDLTWEPLAACCLCIAAKQSHVGDPATHDAYAGHIEGLVSAASGVPVEMLSQLTSTVRVASNNNLRSVSSLQVLKLYLSRLGCDVKDAAQVHSISGYSILVIAQCLADVQFLAVPPSVLAAMVLYSCRQLKGLWPYWPRALAVGSGYDDVPSISQGVMNAVLYLASQIAAAHGERAA